MTDQKSALDLDDLAARPRDVDAAAADQITGGAKSKGKPAPQSPTPDPGAAPMPATAPTGPALKPKSAPPTGTKLRN